MDIKTICMIISVALSFCTFISGAVAFMVIRFNDFAHVEKGFEKAQGNFEKFDEKINEKIDNVTVIVNKNSTEIAVLNTKIN